MFIRCRKGNSKYSWAEGSHQLIEAYREGGKVKQRVVANLGPWQTINEAIEGWARDVERLQDRLGKEEDRVAKSEQYARYRTKGERSGEEMVRRLFPDLQVEREIKVELKKGANTVVLGGLPSKLKDWSIKGRFADSFQGKILSMAVEKHALLEKRKGRIKELEDKIAIVRKQDEVLIDELQARSMIK